MVSSTHALVSNISDHIITFVIVQIDPRNKGKRGNCTFGLFRLEYRLVSVMVDPSAHKMQGYDRFPTAIF